MKTIALSIKILFILGALIFQDIDINSLKKDTTLIKYKKVMLDLKSGLLEKRYQLPPNIAQMQKEFIANPTKEFMKKKLKENGMANADEYVDKVFLQTSLMLEFLKKHPELTKLEPKSKSEVFSKLLFE